MKCELIVKLGQVNVTHDIKSNELVLHGTLEQLNAFMDSFVSGVEALRKPAEPSYKARIRERLMGVKP